MAINSKDYEYIQDLIEQFEDDIDFGDGVLESWINSAESRLGFSLPTSYKWWLLTYGGGEIYGDEIYSLYGPSDDKAIYSGDIVYQYEINVKNGYFSKDQLPILNVNGDDYYFDLSFERDDSEYPVYSTQMSDTKYADNFLEFLKKQIC